jgi:hypothetical protein
MEYSGGDLLEDGIYPSEGDIWPWESGGFENPVWSILSEFQGRENIFYPDIDH